MDAPWTLDDALNIVDSPALHWTEFSLDNVKSTFDSSLLRSRPVANLSFALDHLAGGLEPKGFHRTNLLLHMATGLTLLWLCVLYVRLTPGAAVRPKTDHFTTLLALVPVALFLLHPLNTQAVTYVVQRMSLLAALFTLLSFSCYLMARHRVARRPGWWYSAAILFGIFGFGSKENAILLLPAVLIYEACFFRDGWRAWAENKLGKPWARQWTIITWTSVTVTLVIAAAAVMITSDSFGLFGRFPGRDYSGLERVLTQFRVQVFHLSQLVWPVPSRLNLDHDFSVSRGLLNPSSTLAAAIICLGLLISAILLAIRKPQYGFPLVGYALFHSLESGPVNLEIIFEHRMYLPMSMLALLGAVLLVQTGSRHRVMIVAGLAVAALFFASWTHTRNSVWGDAVALSRDMALKSPQKPRTQHNYAVVLKKSDRVEEALPFVRKAIDLDPTNVIHRGLLGEILVELGRPDEAIEVYETATGLSPNAVKAVLGLGRAFVAAGQAEVAFRHYLDNGIRFGSSGRPWEAIPLLEAATDLRSNDADAISALGSAYSAAGLKEKAIEQFNLAISLDAGQYQAWFNLGVTAESLGRRDEAIRAFQGFLEHAPPNLNQTILSAQNRIEALKSQADR
jgi:tetratricopeptide (TPR) repeat protein